MIFLDGHYVINGHFRVDHIFMSVPSFKFLGLSSLRVVISADTGGHKLSIIDKMVNKSMVF